MTVDIGNLLDLVDGGVTQPVKSETLESVIPANLRGADGKWYALRCATACCTSKRPEAGILPL